MGAFMSKVEEGLNKPRVKKARNRMSKLVSTAWWLGGHGVWTVMTSVIVLAVPVFFEYEKECQMFEQMAQMQGAQMAAAAP
mmetsp:Transcript_78605/g.138567  ORF Transcript_78605/g.138567 Transcript_78605/m.138567 type:complete len:81 (-) Transcript_78605:65-307(-)|eukprot:CAMPEP_0197651130 /NCGR_PEP_ID=MMETSP1338-20131121/31371_1 /TAXON_ID=43686 ORGANISM="Pelagodinium beii, Strain RCC1491" /NCGR_SAMPLE_ID=MMETSP1338 /ASSEMBLY_ACC=CAM_ASM_000754 /LENGTH=80 /DNA_ID=CAMNT_0043225693 /DNA_START=65 /DNA_END=307 /DNA_ORIENTATION=+